MRERERERERWIVAESRLKGGGGGICCELRQGYNDVHLVRGYFTLTLEIFFKLINIFQLNQINTKMLIFSTYNIAH